MKEITIDAGYKPQVGDVTQHGWTCTESCLTYSVFNAKHNPGYYVKHIDLWLWHGLSVTREEEVTGKPLVTMVLLDDEGLYLIDNDSQLHLYDALVKAGAQKGDKLHVIKAEGE